MSFDKGFKKSQKKCKLFVSNGTPANPKAGRINLAQSSTLESENKALYPAPNTMQNVSGSDKVAFATPPSPLSQHTGVLQGLRGGARSMSQPARVTTQMSPYGAPKGAVGVTGVPNTRPFQRITSKPGRRPHLGLKSISAAKKGL